MKDRIPHYVGMFRDEYVSTVEQIKTPRDFCVRQIGHSTANDFVFHHHYLKRRIYIARNVSYGLYADTFLIGVAMYGFPVWIQYPGLVPPNEARECPELIRLCTMSNMPKNTESWFLARTIKSMEADWKDECGSAPNLITSFCDLAHGFDGAIYKATNFKLHNITSGRPTNPNGKHGKWGGNTHDQKPEKAMYIYIY